MCYNGNCPTTLVLIMQFDQSYEARLIDGSFIFIETLGENTSNDQSIGKHGPYKIDCYDLKPIKDIKIKLAYSNNLSEDEIRLMHAEFQRHYV